MASDIDICNSALIKLGVEPIVSFGDDSKEARLCKEQYPKIRDCMLESHPWNFAMKRSSALAESATLPNFGFSISYVLPSDCLRVWHLNVKTARFKVEKGRLLNTDLSGAFMLYICREEDVSKFSSQFKEALAYKIAVDLGYSLIQSSSVIEKLNRKADIVLRDARSFDGQEGSNDHLMSDEWLNSRFNRNLEGFRTDEQI